MTVSLGRTEARGRGADLGSGPLTRKTSFGAETKVLSGDSGIVQAVVSVTGIVDDVRDLIAPGAYQQTLTQRVPKCCDSHDWDSPVGRTLAAEELMPGDARLPDKVQAVGGGGLLVTTQFNLDTQAGRDSFSNVAFFANEQEWSIGYVVPAGGSTFDSKTGVRTIKSLDLFEYSPVLFGANAYTGTVSLKGRGYGRRMECRP